MPWHTRISNSASSSAASTPYTLRKRKLPVYSYTDSMRRATPSPVRPRRRVSSRYMLRTRDSSSTTRHITSSSSESESEYVGVRKRRNIQDEDEEEDDVLGTEQHEQSEDEQVHRQRVVEDDDEQEQEEEEEEGKVNRKSRRRVIEEIEQDEEFVQDDDEEEEDEIDEEDEMEEESGLTEGEGFGSHYYLRDRRAKLAPIRIAKEKRKANSRYFLRGRSSSTEMGRHLEFEEESAQEADIDTSNMNSMNNLNVRASVGSIRKRKITNVQGDQLLPISWNNVPDNDADSDDQGGESGSKLLADISPIVIEEEIDWNQIGGLESHVNSLKEMVILPLLYPEFFEKFNIQPPRGVLFYGPPGTGKTLTARALASSCSKGGTKVSFFMRKGADVLSKWVGESERQLRLLFEEATRLQPSVIFFDEIDGLAPVRSSKQDQIHSSIVSTLLALMDGLQSRGQVIVIGATNRVDAIDPALRRPGRFDRELGFSLPSKDGRQDILRIHMDKWKDRMSNEEVEVLANRSAGFSGADLRALCTEASLEAVKRVCPTIFESQKKLDFDVANIRVTLQDFESAFTKIVPTSKRVVASCAYPLPAILRPLLEHDLESCRKVQHEMFPLGALSKAMMSNRAKSSDNELKFQAVNPHKARFLIWGEESSGQEYIAHALLHDLEEYPTFSLDYILLLKDPFARSVEDAACTILQQALSNSPSVIYIPKIDQWWQNASPSLQQILLNFMDSPDSNLVYIISTSNCAIEDLSENLSHLFDSTLSRSYELKPVSCSSDESKIFFFKEALAGSFVTKLKKPNEVIPSQIPENTYSDAVSNDIPESKDAVQLSNSKSDRDHKAIPPEVLDKALLKMRLRLRSLCMRFINDFKHFKHSPSFFCIPQEEALGVYEDQISEPIFLSDILNQINSRKCNTPKQFLRLIDKLVENTQKFYSASNAYCIGIINQVCQLQDMALASVYTYPSELVKLCDRVDSENIMVAEPENINGNPAEVVEGSSTDSNLNSVVLNEDESKTGTERNESVLDEEKIVPEQVSDSASSLDYNAPVSNENAQAEMDTSLNTEDLQASEIDLKMLIANDLAALTDHLLAKCSGFLIDQMLMLISRVQVLIIRYRTSNNLYEPVTNASDIEGITNYIIEQYSI